jgi:thiol-disulfide isomerase/thioredoxin
VVDLHQEWCGPCDALGPTLQRLYVDYDNSDSRLVLASAAYTSDQAPGASGASSPLSPLGAKIQAAIPAEFKVHLETNGCMPLFALLRVLL